MCSEKNLSYLFPAPISLLAYSLKKIGPKDRPLQLEASSCLGLWQVSKQDRIFNVLGVTDPEYWVKFLMSGYWGWIMGFTEKTHC